MDRLRNVDEMIARAEALYGVGETSGLQKLIDALADARERDRDKIAVALARITKRRYRTDYRAWLSVRYESR